MPAPPRNPPSFSAFVHPEPRVASQNHRDRVATWQKQLDLHSDRLLKEALPGTDDALTGNDCTS